jgi:hypothetical protein
MYQNHYPTHHNNKEDMTYIITGTADLLNRLKEDLAKNGWLQMDNDSGTILKCYNSKFFAFFTKTPRYDKKLALTPENYNEVLGGIMKG